MRTKQHMQDGVYRTLASFIFHPVLADICIHTTSFFLHPYPHMRPCARARERGWGKKKEAHRLLRNVRDGVRHVGPTLAITRRIALWSQRDAGRDTWPHGGPRRLCQSGSAGARGPPANRYSGGPGSSETHAGTAAVVERVCFRCPNAPLEESHVRINWP